VTAAQRNRAIVGALAIMALATSALLVILAVRPYLAWLAGWSIATFAAYGIDKGQARRGGWRIPELGLHGLALAGGAAGGWLGMAAFHHKTRHPRFIVVLAVATALQAALGVALLTRS
jgi:uncharacterized membrane protein YsdA (DUF1294 family)